jgi:hypothetical protein
MSELPRAAGDGEGPEQSARPAAGTSRWQKVVGTLGLVVLLWVGRGLYGTVTGDVAGGGGHGPAPSAPAQTDEPETDGPGGHVPPAGGHRPPAGGHR